MTEEKMSEEVMIDNKPGLDKQGAIYKARQEGPNVSPCGYCNRGDCIECSYAYKRPN